MWHMSRRASLGFLLFLLLLLHRLNIRFTERYPLEPPEVTFLTPTPIHPHIYSNGHICLDILYDGQNGGWSPALTINKLCLSLRSMLASNTDKVSPENSTWMCWSVCVGIVCAEAVQSMCCAVPAWHAAQSNMCCIGACSFMPAILNDHYTIYIRDVSPQNPLQIRVCTTSAHQCAPMAAPACALHLLTAAHCCLLPCSGGRRVTWSTASE